MNGGFMGETEVAETTLGDHLAGGESPAAGDAGLEPVVELFDSTGVPARLAGAAVTQLGKGAGQRLREDPWRLLALPGVRPGQADHFARQVLGQWDPADPRRGRALVEHLLTRAAGDGHTVLAAETVVSAISSFDIAEPAGAVEAALDDGQVLVFESADLPEAPAGPPEAPAAEDPTGGTGDAAAGDDEPEPAGGPSLGLVQYALAEEAVAEGVARLGATAGAFPTAEPVASAIAAQPEGLRAACAAVVQHGVSVVATGPDDGRLIRALAAIAEAGTLRLAVAAATERAAAELAHHCAVPVVSLYELLACRVDDSGGQTIVGHGEQHPFAADLVVITGAATLTAESAGAVLDACPDGARLVLVADPAELPSSGPGRVLDDLLESGVVPVTELSAPATDTPLSRLCAAVATGGLPPVDSPDRDVVVVRARDGGEAAHRVIQLVSDSIPRALGIAVEDIQVVTPLRRGVAGADALNAALKARLNPGPTEPDHAAAPGAPVTPGPSQGAGPTGPAGGQVRFDPGDRVLLASGYLPATLGESGVLTAVDRDGVDIAFPRTRVRVPRHRLGLLRHAWATTVHRAQGGLWPAVVAVLPGEAAGALSRPLVYTAFTRALRHLSVVHAAGPALAHAVRDGGRQRRHTRLVQLLRELAPVASPAIATAPLA